MTTKVYLRVNKGAIVTEAKYLLDKINKFKATLEREAERPSDHRASLQEAAADIGWAAIVADRALTILKRNPA